MRYTAEQQQSARAKWVAALFSDRFTQATSSLVNSEPKECNEHGVATHFRRKEHCCLGVAVEVMIEEGMPGIRVAPNGAAYEYLERCESLEIDAIGYDEDTVVVVNGDRYSWIEWEDGNLPPTVAHWLGIDQDGTLRHEEQERLSREAGYIGVNGRKFNSCINLNDEAHMNFRQIGAVVQSGGLGVSA